MISTRTAAQLLDFGARIGAGQRADEQLEGAVAIHNILETRSVAYLADEVGMGKTYVALGALALLRHFNPDLRVLVIAPRENIQYKWMKDMGNFVRHNVRYPDMRVKALDDRPARPLVACGNLLELVAETMLNPDRDFFVRLSSFSLPVGGRNAVDPVAARNLRDGLRQALPWLPDDVFDLRNKQAFKDSVARAVCCALPRFDLVIVDEAHNLKHGFSQHVAARNRVLGLALGRGEPGVDPGPFKGYRSRVDKVLLLSATPVEETYAQLWNQLDVLGRGKRYEALRARATNDQPLKELAADFLIRRVTAINIQGVGHTKNMYRREWQRGGVHVHDEPITVQAPRQRLVVALVQKKVSELLGHARFNKSFQVGMLASFESFLETARVRQATDDAANFDGAEQTEDDLEREGIDVADINRLCRSYRARFGTEMPHPKMDAVVESLQDAWRVGRKSLIFVRRVASVRELKQKLDERYDGWLMARLLRESPPKVQSQLKEQFQTYKQEKAHAKATRENIAPRAQGLAVDEPDNGGIDTFFAWFFRGDGPPGVVSGANIQQRFTQRSTAYATFFEDNYVADLLGCRPGEVTASLAVALKLEEGELHEHLRGRARRYLTRARKVTRGDRFEAMQAAAVELLKEHAGPVQAQARIVWHNRFESSLVHGHALEAPEVEDTLETATFFTRLRDEELLLQQLWPEPTTADPTEAFRERELRRQLLAVAARLGHAFIDLYVMTIRRLGSLALRGPAASDSGAESGEVTAIDDYLGILEQQRITPLREREWGAYDELAAIAAQFNLLLDVNDPDARNRPLNETTRSFGQLMRQQQPTGGMSGQLNQTLVRQFRMPGYPFVLVTTDLLQEGEDLHTFCADVHHYGIAWTPSSMEQRIGRIDRVRSLAERRLGALDGAGLHGTDMLQVYFPHLEDTVEVLQVNTVLSRMHDFLRLMHNGLTAQVEENRTINTVSAMAAGLRRVQPILTPLETAFPVRPEHLKGDDCPLAVVRAEIEALHERFRRLTVEPLPGLDIRWEPQPAPGVLHGTAQLGPRIQPLTLLLRSFGSRPSVRCISPVGYIHPESHPEEIVALAARSLARVGAIKTAQPRTYDLTAEDEVLLSTDAGFDAERVGALVLRVVTLADDLEQAHLPGRDESLQTFKADLDQEATRGR